MADDKGRKDQDRPKPATPRSGLDAGRKALTGKDSKSGKR
jgi:hypothetical protein